MDDLDYTTIIEFGEPFAGWRGEARWAALSFMRYLSIILLAVVCFSWRSGAQEDSGNRNPGFPVIPPIADANPSVRHPLALQVPTSMFFDRRGNSFMVGYSKFQSTTLTVGYKMVTGVMCDDSIYLNGVRRPLDGSMDGRVTFDCRTNILTLGRNGVPPAGQEFTFERQVTVFETDLPPQHRWSPQSGKYYRVLWTRTFKTAVK